MLGKAKNRYVFRQTAWLDPDHGLRAYLLEASGDPQAIQTIDPKTGRIANVYYWQSETGLRQLMNHPQHLAAKQRYQQWLSGYQVIVSQVLRSYGDSSFAHPAQPLATQS